MPMNENKNKKKRNKNVCVFFRGDELRMIGDDKCNHFFTARRKAKR